MRLRNPSRNHFAIALIATLTLAVGGVSAALTQDPVEDAESWRDQIGPNDERVTGIVGEVHDDSFELQSHGTLYYFDIPSDPDQLADVRTGNEVQVWYDPAGYQRDGNAYYRTSVVALADESTDPRMTDRQPASTQAELSTSPETAPVPADTEGETSTQADQAQVELESQDEAVQADLQPAVETDESEEESTLIAQGDPSQEQSTDDQLVSDAPEAQLASNELDSETDDAETLPQTAGALPLVALTGLLGLFGAVALRILRS